MLHGELYLVLCGGLKGKEIQKRRGMCIHRADTLCQRVETKTAL